MLHINSYEFHGQTITFELEFFPRIYIIGGQNGCGKSMFLKSLFMTANGKSLDNTESTLKFIETTDEGIQSNVLTFLAAWGTLNDIPNDDPQFDLSGIKPNVFFIAEDIDEDLKQVNPKNVFSYYHGPFGKLSRGERKREVIKRMLKVVYWEGKSVVLMDNLDAGFHPDWQYQIIRDLQDWAPQHQYIITSHSYDMCEALTPAHIKELPCPQRISRV